MEVHTQEWTTVLDLEAISSRLIDLSTLSLLLALFFASVCCLSHFFKFRTANQFIAFRSQHRNFICTRRPNSNSNCEFARDRACAASRLIPNVESQNVKSIACIELRNLDSSSSHHSLQLLTTLRAFIQRVRQKSVGRLQRQGRSIGGEWVCGSWKRDLSRCGCLLL